MGNVFISGQGTGVLQVNGQSGIAQIDPRNHLLRADLASNVSMDPKAETRVMDWSYDPATDTHTITTRDKGPSGYYNIWFLGVAMGLQDLLDADCLTLNIDNFTGDTSYFHPYVQLRVAKGTWTDLSRPAIIHLANGERSVTFRIPEESKAEATDIRLLLSLDDNDTKDKAGVTFTFSGISLRKGNVPMSYSLAPEDIDCRIAAINAKIGITASDPPMVEGPEIMDYPAGG